MTDFINLRIEQRPDVATSVMPLSFSPATPEAAGAWIASLIENGVLQPIGGWLCFKQVGP